MSRRGSREIREVLRLWLRGEGQRSIARLAALDRKTVRRYVEAATAAGLDRDAGEEAIGDELISLVCEAVRPHRRDGHGAAWAVLEAHHDQLKAWLVDQGLTVVKVHDLLCRRGVTVPQRTLHRYALEVLGVGRSARTTTVRVADGEPGSELQVDFGKMGLVFDSETGRRRVCWALIFTAAYSRHCFVWLGFRQTTAATIAGFEAAWVFFGGVFKVAIPDNMSAIVDAADRLEPRINQAFMEYAQARGFVVDPARVRTPTDKPRVERTVPFVRNSFFAGEDFVDLADAQRRAVAWCRDRAGMRIHGTTACRPAELFALEEAPALLPAPTSPYDLPAYSKAKVHRDHHIEVAKALYSVPGNLIGHYVDARADSKLVRVSHRGVLIKVHPRTRAGGRVTDPADLPAERSAYALRDIEHLKRLAAGHGDAVGTYAAALLDHPLPWTKMRQVYALLGLVKRWGPERVEAACRRAVEAEAVDVGLIGRMLERAVEAEESPPALAPAPAGARFARDPGHFAIEKSNQHKGSSAGGATGGAA
ncbi:MAG TPA: IS21 family transposase [Acidimicrobiales bacterium]|nr:IS21 family transposase [Acidimicrobiales bacterium]